MPLPILLLGLAFALGAPLARADTGLADLEMDVMESGETPARAMSRIALPAKPTLPEPALDAEARAGMTPDGESLFRAASDARIEAPAEVPEPVPPGEGSD